MRTTAFPTSQDAENAFYEALERADLEAMMAVWAEDEEIVCVHPTGPRLAGHAQVHENPPAQAGPRRPGAAAAAAVTVVATNIYLRTAVGWRMVLHHASHAPGPIKTPRAQAPPKILH